MTEQYIAEAEAIASAQQALDARMARLVERVRKEAPSHFAYASDFGWPHGADAHSFAHYLRGGHRVT